MSEKSFNDVPDVEGNIEKQIEKEKVAQAPAAPVALGPPAGGPPSFPEGGLNGWLAVLGCWSVMFITFGYMNAFGVYEAYYLGGMLSDKSADDVAWIGSIQLFAMFAGGLISGPINDRFGPTVVIAPSTLLFSLSVLLTSLCTEYYQFILCQGIFGGIFMGIAYSPAIAVVGHYFLRKRPLVMGIASTGSALAGIVLPLILDKLFNHSDIGFPWSQRIIGFMFLALSLLAIFTIKAGVPPRLGTYFLPAAFKNPAYSLQVAGIFFVFWGLFGPFFYLPTYAEMHGVSQSLSFHLATILNAGSIVGRIISGGLGIHAGQFNVVSFCSYACAVLILCWMKITTSGGLIAFAVLYGFFSGGVIGTMLSTIPLLAEHPSQIGTYIGMMSGIVSFAALTGAPIDGALIEKYGSFTQAIIFSGVVCLFGATLILGARFSHGGKKLIV